MIELQASGGCYSWRFPPPRWLGGGLRRSLQEACVVLITREPQRATLVEHVIKLPSLGSWGSYGAQRVGLVWCHLATEPPSERSTQQGLACWQTREPQDKNHRVNIVFPLVCIPITQACMYFHIHCTCVVALVIS